MAGTRLALPQMIWLGVSVAHGPAIYDPTQRAHGPRHSHEGHMTGTYGLIFRSGDKTATNGIISDRSLARAPATGSIIIGAQGARGLRRSDDGSWTDRAPVHARQSDRQLHNLP